MKKGDIVMFTDKGRYARWFYGQLGTITNYTPDGSDGKSHCRVKWLHPVKYFTRHTSTSDFCAEYFEVISESR